MPTLPTLFLVVAAAHLCTVADAKGGGGGRSSGGGGGGSSGVRSSGSRSSGSGGRTTSSGRAVPAACRSCYYGSSGMFYHRVFLFSYMGRTRQCYSCGRRGDGYDIEKDSITLQTVTGSFNITLNSNALSSTTAGFSRAELEDDDSAGHAQLVQHVAGRISSGWWQWSDAAATRTTWPPATKGFAEEFGIELSVDNLTNSTAVVTFVALFESPTVTAATAAASAATLYAGCVSEAHCVQCGVPSPSGSCNHTPTAAWANTSCPAECAACAVECEIATVPGSKLPQGPKDHDTTCTPLPPPFLNSVPFMISSCTPFANSAIVLTSQMGDVVAEESGSNHAFTVVIGILVLLLVFCCIKTKCNSDKRRARGGRRPEMERSPERQPGYAAQQNWPPQQQPQPQATPIMVQAVPMVEATPVITTNEITPMVATSPVVQAKAVD